MLCDICKSIPYDIFTTESSFIHSTQREIKETAATGCGFCQLIRDSFQLQKRRGKVRELADHCVNEYVVLAHVVSWLPCLDLLYKDDISASNGVPLWFSVPSNSDNAAGQTATEAKTSIWSTLLEAIPSWERDCRVQHHSCAEKLKSRDRFLPTRLIDVGFGQNTDFLPRLVLTNTIEDQSVSYLTLSHRWGPINLMASLIRSNAESRLTAIEDLPLTFCQAISIAKQLHIPYIWIDSQCIIQDDENDKAREVAMMERIYSNSYCNIVASTASDPTQGCFDPTRIEAVEEFTLELPTEPTGDGPPYRRILINQAERLKDELVSGSESGTLHDRGWLLQERHLPERAVVFTPRAVIWQCQNTTVLQKYTGLTPSLASRQYLDEYPVERDEAVLAMQPKFHPLRLRAKDPLSQYSSWLAIVSEYSNKSLTFPSDKLPAIGGLAKRLQKSIGDDYLAGLWRRDLVRQLCWLQNEKQEFDHLPGYTIGKLKDWDISKRYRAPTWSWASLDLKICYPPFDETVEASLFFASTESPEIIDAATTPISVDPFGHVSSGVIRFRGKMVDIMAHHLSFIVVLPLSAPVYRQEQLKRLRVYNRLGNPIGKIILDRQNWTLGVQSSKEDSNMVICCLRMWKLRKSGVRVLEDGSKSWESKLIGLALRRVADGPDNVYERIGILFLMAEEGQQLFKDDGFDQEALLV